MKLLILMLLVLSVFATDVLHGSAGASLNATINIMSVHVTANLLMWQNLTTVLPTINANVNLSNSSLILAPIQKAIQKLTPPATITALTLQAKSSNSSNVWRLWENYTLDVRGINRNSGSTVTSSLSFLRFNVTDPITVGGGELNYAPRAYVLPKFNELSTSQTAFYINGHQSRTAAIPAITTNALRLLDFTFLPTISIWSQNRDPLQQSTSWKYEPLPRFNLTIGTSSPEGILIKAYEAVYAPSFQITVPAAAWTDGGNVFFDTATPLELIMPILIIAVVALLIITIFFDRRLARRIVRRRKP